MERYRIIYKLLNKHGACIYKCDSYEVMIKHYLQDKDIISRVITEKMRVLNY